MRKKRAGESQPSAVCRYIYQHELGGIQEAVQEKRERKRERGGMFEKWNRGGIWEMEGGGCRGWMHRDPGGNSEGV